ncbi:bifunctional riboflavin kinase/FAD synthetase [Echinimonas agarilytica]|uniref:Riboflavin biosynthesis protein n=1 Tax=Echinimonas agarilytica TaxID=1215918 RepID=A0AA42B845_9GAMM|nr:bifunctional riboflavin kinase/FAD synthetase [Echinimonas agarilytica]MCM2680602.1 bifunctional riboflavin kinase/FAD synthetase [Echinimonas agarilytica]
MELIRGIHNLRPEHQGCVLTIGNFDGVHLGHQAVIKQLVAKAKEYQLPSTVMVFEPQPQEVFARETAPARLSLLRDKVQLLAELGVDRLLCIQFNQHFSSLTAEQFISQLLVTQLAVKFLVVGDDFRFGQKRQGDFDLLLKAGQQHHFVVANTASFVLSQMRVSSTKIRAALSTNQLDDAQSMLGRKYALTGRVAHGKALGRTIGFPTANVFMKRQVVPVKGVYAVEVELASGERRTGMANIGTRPTVNGTRCQLEVHIFDFEGNLYGQRIRVELVAKLREEQPFASVEALTAQLHQDKLNAQSSLAQL